jgi:diguanylate cyclase (GGDEF)-like protein
MLLIAILLFSAGRSAAAAAGAAERWSALTHTSFKHHTAADISGTTVFAQDHSGFLWMGTQSGLVRWDGYRLRRYTPNPQRTDALPDTLVLSLHVDPRGRLWIGTSSGGLARYDADTDTFVNYQAGPAGLSSVRVAALADDGSGGLWIGTGAGLDHMDADGVLRRAAGGGAGQAALPEGGVDALLHDRSGSLWIGTRNGLVRRSPRQQDLVPVLLAPRAPKALAINALFQDSSARIWVGTRTAGAFVIEAGAGGPVPVRETGKHPSLHNERVISIAEAGSGEVWLATEGSNGGIVAVDPLRGTTRRIRHQPDVPDSLHDNDVYALFRERSGLVFVGSMLAMSQHDPHQNAVKTVRGTGVGPTGRLSIPSVLARPDGRVWLGVTSGGIDIIDPLLGGVGRLRPGEAAASDSLPKGRVLAMANGPDGAVYIGTQQGLFRSDSDGRRVRRLEVPQRSATAPVYAMAWAGEVLWIGGLDGLWALALAPGAAPRLLRREDESLGDSRITALLPVAGGALWVGTRTGLARLEADSSNIEKLPSHASDKDKMLQGYVSSMLLDRTGRLWVSSYGAGVALLERTDPDGRRRFRRIGAAQGLKDSSVDVLLEAGDGMIWVSTDSGLARIDPATFAVSSLGAAEGVHVSSYWTNAGARSAAGELLFGGLSGLTVVRPDMLTQWRYQAPVAVTRILLNEKEIPGGRYNRGAASTPIEVSPEGRERGFSLEFAALDYSASERNLYAYRLAGFDADWIQHDDAFRRVSYNNLPPGDYMLQLRGSNREGAWAPPLNVPVRVLPAWHQEAWVRIGAGLATLGLLAALVQVRTAYFRRRQRELQSMVDTRTAELRATQSQLEKLAYADPLTGLPNRRLFNDELRHMAAQATRDGASFTLLLIDLDHFKHINDTLGHDAGDALLVTVAARLQLSVREADRLSRLGGDEFAVLLSKTDDIDTIDIICQRIVASMAEAIPYGQASMKVSASIGAAIFRANESEVEALYKAADLALYQAKASGRNTWSLHWQGRPVVH